MFEIHNPVHIEFHEYWPDSAGAGRWRGGLGVDSEFVVAGENVTAIAFGDGVDEEARAFGLFGGTAGAINNLSIEAPDGSLRRPQAKEIVRDIEPGSRIRQQAGGGGGYGQAHERPIESVLDDVRNALVSPESARTLYAVVIDPQTLALDRVATQKLRTRPT